MNNKDTGQNQWIYSHLYQEINTADENTILFKNTLVSM
jgi:hypothetical protein